MLKNWPEGKTALICCRRGDPYWKEVPGSVIRQCFNCGHDIHASPSSVALEKVEPHEYVCVNCHKAYIDSSGRRTRILPLTPAQAQERGEERPSREGFIESYVAVKVAHAGEKDTPELRKLAGEVYDALIDNSPEGNAALLGAIGEVCQNVAKKSDEPPST